MLAIDATTFHLSGGRGCVLSRRLSQNVEKMGIFGSYVKGNDLIALSDIKNTSMQGVRIELPREEKTQAFKPLRKSC